MIACGILDQEAVPSSHNTQLTKLMEPQLSVSFFYETKLYGFTVYAFHTGHWNL